jgi:3-oxoacyl-[acyl-carrier protein] reductase
MGDGLGGKVAIVTGGGSGIGEAICKRLAADGAAVAALDISLPTAEATIAEIGAGLALEVDVSSSAAIDAAVATVERRLGPPDVFVNNAGAIGIEHVRRVQPRLDAQADERAAGGRVGTPLDALVRLEDEEWRALLAVHLDGTFFGTRAAARSMGGRGGSIVNMASICGLEGCTGHPHYSAAKAGILGFTRSVAKELIVQGIRVNAVAPGFIDTSKNRGELDSRRRAEANRTPAGRLGTPEEVAATVAFLASADAAFYVGATLSPNGGLVTAV